MFHLPVALLDHPQEFGMHTGCCLGKCEWVENDDNEIAWWALWGKRKGE